MRLVDRDGIEGWLNGMDSVPWPEQVTEELDTHEVVYDYSLGLRELVDWTYEPQGMTTPLQALFRILDAMAIRANDGD